MTHLKRVPRLLATLALVVGYTGIASAAVIVDSFANDQFVPASGPNPSSASGSTVLPSANILGQFRGLYVEKTAGSTKASKTVKLDVDSSVSLLTFSRDGGIGGQALVQWDGDQLAPTTFDPRSNLSFNLNGGSPLDFTAGGEVGLLLRVFGADIAGQQVRITLFGPNATVASEAVVTLPAVNGGPVNVQVPFASFAQTSIGNGAVFNALSAASATQVYAITLGMTGPDSSDLSIGTLSTYAPEPTSAALLGMGGFSLFGLLRARLRNRRASER